MASETTPQSETSPLEAITYAYGTDVGKRREENQDSLGVIETSNLKFFIVCDGMGGVKGGAIASNLAVSAIKEVLGSKSTLGESEICEALGEANARIFEKGMEDPALAGMGTTFVGLGFVGTGMYIASVGDSRAYRVRGSGIEQLTEDHTLVMELLRSGAISAEQAGNHPVSHMLTRSLGPTPSVEVDCWLCPDGPAAGDIYLLCSDGLYNLVGAEEFLDIIQSSTLDEAVQELIDLANLRGGTDNITVMMIQVDERFPVSPDQFPQSVQEEVPEEEESAGEEAIQTATNGHAEPSADNFELKEDPVEVAPSIEPERVSEIAAEVGAKSERSSEARKEERSSKGPAISVPPQGGATSVGTDATSKSGSDVEKESKKTLFGGRSSFLLALLATAAAGYAGGIFATRLNQNASVRPVQEAVAPVPLAAEVARLDLGGPVQDRAPEDRGEVPELRAPGSEPAGSGLDNGSMGTGYHGLPQEEIARIIRRKQMLRDVVRELDQKIGSFDRPFSGKAGEILADVSRRQEELRTSMERVRSEIDKATRKLSVWFGRRKRLQTDNIVNLSTEVAVTSTVVREKSEAFQRATWSYLKEAEILRYNPNDRVQDAKVADLIRARKERMQELFEEVRRAIDKEITDSDRQITDLTNQRDRTEAELESLRREIEYVRVLASGDSSARAAKKRELVREREISIAELEELNHLLPESNEGGLAPSR